ncbi:MAG: hypothetical protein OXP36_12330, partial [Gammaproteobacteria bacterium]|nr:hypothetical protein [Gammaproteobacteria bacterium]
INPAREGSGGHWIIQDGAISDPDGVDISAKFVPGDMENNLTKIGPLYFDFNAPRVTDASEVTIEGRSIQEAFYSGNRALGDDRSQRVGISNVSEGGSGGQWGSTTQIVAVGDCSISANADTGERGAGTAFQALVEDANAIGDLPEDDPYSDDLSDDGGVQCYTAELQSITDPLGNARSLGNVRIQSASNFGVDRTAPEVDDLLPDEELVLMDGAVLTFEVDDPDLETGENSSGLDEESPWAYWGPSSSWSQRYFYSTQDGAPSGVVSNVEDGVVTIATNTGDSEADKERRYVVVALVQDNAVPPNRSSTSFAYTRDSEGPAVSLSKSQSDIGNIGTQTVTVGVGGTISDKNVIKVADLSIRMIAADAGADACMAADDLSQGRTGRVVRNKRDLENDSNKIEFDESFTIRRPTGTGAGPETYCFWLASADVAVEANGRGDGNAGDYELGRFSVGWPEGPAAPPPGPTFDFSTRTDNADPATASALTDALEVTEGDATGVVYHVTLKDVATAPTAAAPVSVTVSAPPGLSVNIDGGTAGASQTLSFTAATDTVAVTVTADHDGDIDSEALSVNHTATGYTAASVGVTSMDDDFMISASVTQVRENDDAMDVLVTVTAGSATAAERTATVAATEAGGAASADFTVTGTADVSIAAMATMDTFTLSVDATDDTERGELGEMISLGVSGSADPTATYYMPAEITILDDDPDFQLSLSQDEVAEGAGQVTVTITATPTGTVDVRARTVFTLATTGTAVSGTDYSTNPATITLTVDVGTYDSSDSFTTDVVLTIEEDDDTTTNTTIVFDDADGEGGLTVSENTTLTITDNDSSGDQ